MPATKIRSLKAEEQLAHIQESLSQIRAQTAQMKKLLDTKGKLMEALKPASVLLSELRTLNLSPKNYYELYVAIYDSLELLALFLAESYPAKSLSSLYELVQYAGNIIPRLYLMITVGTVFMAVPDAPVREIMKDMMEMCRGVQHPVRGLFLRYYLSQRTKNLLPQGPGGGVSGGLPDLVSFILTNFVEMNKLWVRLQHQGHSREFNKRLQERKELQILVGSNLVRLSQLDDVDLPYYKKSILPAVLEQIVQCRDVLAQEYLLDVVIQVFPDEFHLGTLKELLECTIELDPKVDVKGILVELVERLTGYVERGGSLKPKDEAAKEGNLEEKVKKIKIEDEAEKPEDFEKPELSEKALGKSAIPPEEHLDVFKMAPDRASSKPEPAITESEKQKEDEEEEEDLFTAFFKHFQQLTQVRPDLTIDDITALYYALSKLSLTYYPEDYDKIDAIFAEVLARFNDLKDTLESSNESTVENLKKLLLLPLNLGSSLKEKLSLQLFLTLRNYQPLLSAQLAHVQSSIANEMLSSLLLARFRLEKKEEIEKLFEILRPIMFRRKTPTTAENLDVANGEHIKVENVAKLLHLVYNKDPAAHLELLWNAFLSLKGKEYAEVLYPSVVYSYLRLVSRLLHRKTKEKTQGAVDPDISMVFQRLLKITDELAENGHIELALKLVISCSQVSNQIAYNEVTNEYFIKVYSLYEEIANSKQQYPIIMQIISLLIACRASFHNGSDVDRENYDLLITKAVLYAARLLKKPDQCRAVFAASHLWFEPGCADEHKNKRVLECLQKSLRIGDSCIENSVTVELFVEILNECLYYYIHGSLISSKYINDLIDLIKGNLAGVDEVPIQHLKRTLEYVRGQRAIDGRFNEIVIS